MRRTGTVLCLAAASLFAGACAETELAIHTAKQFMSTTDEVPRTHGVYKVGKPYQANGIWYYPAVNYKYVESGVASWYGSEFHGKPTANGEIYDMNALTAAHRTLPLPSIVRVVNLRNGRSITVRVNDRGPFARGRIIDMSRRGAQLLGFERHGTAPVRVEILPAESRQAALIAQRGGQTMIARNQVANADSVAVAALPPPGETVAVPFEKAQVPVALREPSEPDRAALELPLPTVSHEPVSPPRLFVQAGSFVRREYAERMRRKLTGIGPARISRARVGQYTFYRVRIGPLANVEQGDAVLNDVIAYGYPDARLIAD